MTPKGMRAARFASPCAVCGNSIGKGEPIADAGGPWGHVECVEFNRNKLLVESGETTAVAARRRGVEVSLLGRSAAEAGSSTRVDVAAAALAVGAPPARGFT
jgi:hypothetical protein